MKKTSFSKNLSRLMRQKGYTQLSFAKAIGVSQGAISMYVREKSTPGARELQLMADLLEVSMDYLWRRNAGDEAKESLYWKEKADTAAKQLEKLQTALETLFPEVRAALEAGSSNNSSSETADAQADA